MIFKYYMYILMVVACILCTLLLSESTTLFSLPLMCSMSKSYLLRKSSHPICVAFTVGYSNKYFIPMLCPQIILYSHEVMPSHFQHINNHCKLPLTSSIIPFMLFVLVRFITNDMPKSGHIWD
jgi:hypothetical protein